MLRLTQTVIHPVRRCSRVACAAMTDPCASGQDGRSGGSGTGSQSPAWAVASVRADEHRCILRREVDGGARRDVPSFLRNRTNLLGARRPVHASSSRGPSRAAPTSRWRRWCRRAADRRRTSTATKTRPSTCSRERAPSSRRRDGRGRTPGDFVNVPRGTVHRFHNAGADPVRLILTFTPAGIEKFFEETLEPARIRRRPRPTTSRRWPPATRRRRPGTGWSSSLTLRDASAGPRPCV